MTWLSAKSIKVGGKVDRERKALLGYVVAQEGPFKSDGRGEFNEKGLKKLAALMNKNPGGTKSRLSHPTMSDDGIGKFLGRAKNARMDSVKLNRNGEVVLLHAVRADLYFDPSAFKTPNGDLATYVMDLAESDPDAISSSVVIDPQIEEQLDAKGRPILDEAGNPKPPLWYPLAIHASDIVDTGDAVDGLLSASGIDFFGLPDGIARQGFEMLKKQFAGKSREFVKQHLSAWTDRALSMMYGEDDSMNDDCFEVGDRIVVARQPNLAGVVRQVVCGKVYGVQFDDSPDISQWYLSSDIALEDPTEEADEELPMPTGMSADVARMKLILAQRGANA